MLGTLTKRIFGSANARRVKGYRSRVDAITAAEAEFQTLNDEARWFDCGIEVRRGDDAGRDSSRLF